MTKPHRRLLRSVLDAAVEPATAETTKVDVINAATTGKPPTLDPFSLTADLVGIVSQHIPETSISFLAASASASEWPGRSRALSACAETCPPHADAL
jgi:hypothetical protein